LYATKVTIAFQSQTFRQQHYVIFSNHQNEMQLKIVEKITLSFSSAFEYFPKITLLFLSVQPLRAYWLNILTTFVLHVRPILAIHTLAIHKVTIIRI